MASTRYQADMIGQDMLENRSQAGENVRKAE